jgi:hypothetical protein
VKPTTVLAFALAVATVIFGLLAILMGHDLDVGFLAYVAGWAAYSAFGALLGALRPRNPIGWLFAIMGVTAQIGLATDSVVSAVGSETGGVGDWLLTLFSGFWFIGYGLVPALLFLFPNGRPPSLRWRIVLALIGLDTVLGTLSSSRPIVGAPIAPVLAANFGVDAALAIVDQLQSYAGIALMALFAAGALTLVVRTRRSRGVERQQLKWIAFAGVLLTLAFAGTTIIFFSPLRALDPEAPFPTALFGGFPFVAALVAVPLASAVAILRYRLYDVDLLIKRTVIYGATSAAIAVTFFLGIVALQPVLRPVTSGSELPVAASTLFSFALFQPIRRRVQGAVDRRFDRARYDAALTLVAFADQVSDEVDLDTLRSDLLGAVAQTMFPAHVSLWLRDHSNP